MSAETTELKGAVISTLAHELGGIASALDLRAAAMASTIAEQDLRALREIAEEVRVATRTARLARGADGSGIMNPMRRQSLEDWWRLTGRFTASILPRGIAVNPNFREVQLTLAQATALTWIWLAGCKELTDRGLIPPATIHLKTAPAPNRRKNAVILKADVDADRVGPAYRVKSRWSRHAGRIAKSAGFKGPSWAKNTDTVSWTLELPV